MTEQSDLSNMGFSLGNHRIAYGLALAPMAGNTNLAYRRLCRRFGAELTCTEMVSSKALEFKDEKSLSYLKRGEDETPVVAQIFGNEPQTLAVAAKEVEQRGFQAVDLNMGCPVPKITGSGGGSSLLRTPELAAQCIQAMVDATSLPVTAKIRTGWDSSSIHAPDFAKRLQDAGAALITVHGRTRAQKYSGTADLDVIHEVVEAVDIPVIGNGDVRDIESAHKMISTGVNGLAIGRGALGRPWLFSQIQCSIRGEAIPETPSPQERATILMELGQGVADLYGEKRGMLIMRRLAADFFQGIPRAAESRGQCIRLSALNDLVALCERLEKSALI